MVSEPSGGVSPSPGAQQPEEKLKALLGAAIVVAPCNNSESEASLGGEICGT
jgi:hypothetical protein